MKNWCLGFVFSPDFQTVLLLRKSKTMHIGLWNGVGGKVEIDESPVDAMKRECKEEAGLDVDNWLDVGRLKGVNNGEAWCVHVFAATHDTHGMNEITADWAENASKDTPFRISLGDLQFLQLAPHTEILAVAAKEKLKNPAMKPLIVAEV